MHTATVTLEQALTGVDLQIETLDGRTLRCVRVVTPCRLVDVCVCVHVCLFGESGAVLHVCLWATARERERGGGAVQHTTPTPCAMYLSCSHPYRPTVCVPTTTHDGSIAEPHVAPGTVKVIRGEGMPLQKKPSEKGNLKVRVPVCLSVWRRVCV